MKRIDEKKYNLLKNIFFVYKGVAKHKPYLIILLFVSIICTVGTKFVWLFLSKYVIEYIESGMQTIELIKIVGVITLMGILFMAGQTIVNCWTDPAAFYVRPMFMLERNKKYFNMSYESMEYREILDSLQKSINATSWPQNGIEGLIRKTIVVFSDLFTCIVSMGILGGSSPLMIILVLIVGIIIYFSIDVTSKKEKQLTKDEVTYQSRKKDYFSRVSRDFTYGKDIRLYTTKDKILSTIKNLNVEIHKKVCEARNQWIKSGIFVGLLEMLREGGMYFYLIFLILNGELGVAAFTLYIGCVRNFASTFHNLAIVYASMRQCNREVNDFRSFDDFCDRENLSGKDVFGKNNFMIEFRNVSFKYPSSDNYALKNFNIKIVPETKLAIVGLNGAGKTTFVKLLLRLYEPTSGVIYMNGININEIDRKKYFNLFSPVFQDLQCFAFTLAENVSMKSTMKTDKEKVEKCLRKAGLGNKIDEWTTGIDTNMQKDLHNDGVVLSGGENQKMGLARALYKDAPIVVLDEPTAALDAMAESKMYQEFDELVKGKIAIYISHRLASTRFCDSIAMFEDGKLIEVGTHEELMKNNGKYAEMYKVQAHYYKEGTEEFVL